MSTPAVGMEARKPPKPRRRPVYRVVSEPGSDPERGEEALIKWLAERLKG